VPTFYRIVKSDPPNVQDFTSNKAQGKAPRGIERDEPSIWAGLSMYDRENEARGQARRIPKLGSFLARLEITESDSIQVRQTGGNPAHHTIWGDPQQLLTCVVAVLAV